MAHSTLTKFIYYYYFLIERENTSVTNPADQQLCTVALYELSVLASWTNVARDETNKTIEYIALALYLLCSFPNEPMEHDEDDSM